MFSLMKRQIKRQMMRTLSYQMRHQKRPMFTAMEIRKFIPFRGNKVDQLIEMMQQITISLQENERFAHWLDEEVWLFHFDSVIGNMPPNYELVIKNSLSDLILYNEKKNNDISRQNIRLLKGVEEYIEQILVAMQKTIKDVDSYPPYHYFQRMKSEKTVCLEEALQRILFWSSLMWQSGHRLVGLGRLDYILDDYIETVEESELDRIIGDFLAELHRYYGFKSAALLGDIGQIVVLGGVKQDGSYFSNDLTYSIIRTIRKIQLPDPKALLRVSKNMPSDLLELAIDCIATGVGSPLLSNDEVVIPALQSFGYKKADAFNYVTSACWEPVSYGNSLEQNNIGNINFAKAFANTMQYRDLARCKTFQEFLTIYKDQLKKNIEQVYQIVSKIRWEKDPLFTLFTDGCIESNKDIADGGAVYSDYGLLSVGMGNAIDSLMNIWVLVYKEKKYTVEQIQDMWISEDDQFSELQNVLKNGEHFFGRDEDAVIHLTNDILSFANEIVAGKRNRFGGRFKYGLSSPAYIVEGEKTAKTLDGRMNGEPMDVHISSKDPIAYTTLLSFGSRLSYMGTNANGNVIDFFVSPFLISSEKEVFQKLILASINLGFFQMQMNVVSSDTLLAAQNNPDQFPSLIVRVWGFSAYFVDLPKAYQDVLIARLLQSEKKEVYGT